MMVTAAAVTTSTQKKVNGVATHKKHQTVLQHMTHKTFLSGPREANGE